MIADHEACAATKFGRFAARVTANETDENEAYRALAREQVRLGLADDAECAWFVREFLGPLLRDLGRGRP